MKNIIKPYNSFFKVPPYIDSKQKNKKLVILFLCITVIQVTISCTALIVIPKEHIVPMVITIICVNSILLFSSYKLDAGGILYFLALLLFFLLFYDSFDARYHLFGLSVIIGAWAYYRWYIPASFLVLGTVLLVFWVPEITFGNVLAIELLLGLSVILGILSQRQVQNFYLIETALRNLKTKQLHVKKDTEDSVSQSLHDTLSRELTLLILTIKNNETHFSDKQQEQLTIIKDTAKDSLQKIRKHIHTKP